MVQGTCLHWTRSVKNTKKVSFLKYIIRIKFPLELHFTLAGPDGVSLGCAPNLEANSFISRPQPTFVGRVTSHFHFLLQIRKKIIF